MRRQLNGSITKKSFFSLNIGIIVIIVDIFVVLTSLLIFDSVQRKFNDNHSISQPVVGFEKRIQNGQLFSMKTLHGS